MIKIPKVVLEGLRRSAGGAAPAGSTASGEGIDQGASRSHPDANQLSCFVERTLREPERRQVLDHLASCAACRELVVLAFPPESVEAATPASAPARVRPWPVLRIWPGLRWAAAGVVGLLVIGFVVLRRPARESTVQISQNNTVPVPPAATRAIKRDLAREAAPQVRGEPGTASLPKPQRPFAEPLSSVQLQGPREHTSAQKDPTIAGPPPGASVLVPRKKAGENDSLDVVGGLAKRERMDSRSLLDSNSAVPATSGLAGSRQGALSEFRARVAPESPAASPPAKRDYKSAASRDDANNQSTGVEGLAESRKAAGIKSRAQQEATTLLLKAGKPKHALNQVLSVTASDKPASAQGGHITPIWSIASAEPGTPDDSSAARGTIERSFDGGKSWQYVHVDDTVSFRTIYAAGLNAWAGGSGDALYYSGDGGYHWTRVLLPHGLQTKEGNITEIIFADSDHGKINSDSGAVWTTSDGGQHWTPTGPGNRDSSGSDQNN